VLYLDCDTLFKWKGMRDAVTGQPIDDATVTGILGDMIGHLLCTFTFSYVTGSDGDYVGVVTKEQAQQLDEGDLYVVEITATKNGSTDVRRSQHTAAYRGDF
jgi:hypothetical protein